MREREHRWCASIYYEGMRELHGERIVKLRILRYGERDTFFIGALSYRIVFVHP